MTVCAYCGQDIATSEGCTVDTLVFGDGSQHERLRWGSEPGVAEAITWRCHDCGAQPGQYHHADCDMETCPACHGQMCGCVCGMAQA